MSDTLEKLLSNNSMVNKLVKTNFGNEFDKYEIIAFGDVHYGHKCVDKKLLKEMLNYMYDTPNLYLLGLGDLIEAATVESVGGGIFEQEEFAQKQYENIADLLKPLKGRIVGLHEGNHEYRIMKHSGFNITKTLCRELECEFLGWGVLHEWTVGDNIYTAYSTHGSSGATTLGGKLNALKRMGDAYDVDAVLMGHVHDLHHFTEQIYSISDGMPITKKKHHILTGSYLSYWDSYAQMKGYKPASLGSPKIKLHASKWDLRVSL